MLNHSCLPCRAKKLKCDGEEPCSNCSKKGVENECLRAARKARPRKTVLTRTSRNPSSNTPTPSAKPTSLSPFSYKFNEDQENTSLASLSGHDTLRNLAKEALGDAETCTTLINRVFYWRVYSICYACLDLAAIKEDINTLFAGTSPTTSSDRIVLCMMVVALAWQYFPKDGSVIIKREINLIDGQLTHRFRQKLLWELSLNYTRHQMSKEESTSLEGIQTIILLLIYDQSGNATRDQMFDYAQRAAKRLDFHTISQREGLESKEEEIKVRAWWFLVTRNWFTSLSTSSYTIHPIHFSTRLPRYLLSLDTHQSDRRESLRPAYSPLHFGQTLILLADMIRSLVDERLSKANNFSLMVEQRFEEFWNKMPSVYSSSSVSLRGDSLLHRISRRNTSERWMLHQLFFHAYLELYQFEPAKSMPKACVSMAHHILNIQHQVDSFCVVLNSLRINVTNIVKASSILILDLMQKPKRDSISRSIILAQVNQALSNCRSSNQSKEHDFILITEMLKAEAKSNGDADSVASTYEAALPFDEEAQQTYEEVRLVPINTSTNATSPDLHLSTPSSAMAMTRTTTNEGPSEDLSWTSLLPHDSGIYPILQANTVEEEWQKAYESFLAMSAA